MTTPAIQKLEQYKQTLEQVKARRTQIQIKLESARQQYQAAAQEAKENFGTDSLPKLTSKLAQMEASNEEAASSFIQAVENFSHYITQIEQAMTSPQAMADWLATQPATISTTPTSTSASSAPLEFALASADDEDI